MKRSADSAFAATPSDVQSPEPEYAPDSPASSSADPTSGPSRKRARSEVTPEERREARAHRNRIAAQNSRDRRKAQFSYLERRVAELEEENRQLRAGMGLTELRRSEDKKAEEREREKAREKENGELRERIKTLENGWDAVVKALAASGLPLNVPTPSTSAPSSESPSNSLSNPPTSTFPVIVPPPIFPMSPAPSHPSPTSSNLVDFDDFESTRHLARVASTDAPPLSSVPLQRLSSSPSSNSDANSSADLNETIHPVIDETVMQDLFREILAPSPSLPSAPLPAAPTSENTASHAVAPSVAPPVIEVAEAIDWDGEAEMQRLLDMLPAIQSDMNSNADMDVNAVDFPSALDLELCGWDMAALGPLPSSTPSVGVF